MTGVQTCALPIWGSDAGRRRPGVLTGLFLTGYGLARFVVEYFREPDPQLQAMAKAFLSMGQVLSLPMILAGLALMLWAWRRPPHELPAGTSRDRAAARP